MKNWLLATVSVGMLAFSVNVQAQTAEESERENVGLTDIVVTAQRRSESLQNAAVPISAVSADMLRDAGVSKVAELTAVVPSLQISAGAGPYSLFYLRGVGNFNGNSLSDSAVAVNFNDVFIARPSATAGFFYDLERVEVVKGPQGTLYGRNATGGAINVLPAKPQPGVFTASLNGEYGNYDTVRLDGAINAPIGDAAAVRLAANYVKHDGYLSDGTDDQDDLGARLSFRFQPTDTLDIRITGDYFRQKGRGPGSTILTGAGLDFSPDDRIGISDPRSHAVYQQTYVGIAGTTLSGIPDTQFADNKSWGVSATVDWETPAGTITIIPAYRENRLDFLSTSPGFQIRQREKNSQTSVEARIASDDRNWFGYIFGLYYFQEEGDSPTYNTNAQYNASFQQIAFDTTSMAAFARLNFNVTDDLTFTLGGRYTTEDKTFGGVFETVSRLCLTNPVFAPTAFGSCPGAPIVPFGSMSVPPAIGGAPGGPVAFYPTTTSFQTYARFANTSRNNFEKFTWRAALDWQFTPDNLIYASFETGFKSGGFFFSNDDNNYTPETIDAYTIGTKNWFFDRRLRANLELFYWKYHDQQISHLGMDSTGAIIFPTENVGQGTFKGFEVETELAVTNTTRLRADVQYLDAKYNNFVYLVPQPVQTGCILTPPGAIASFQVDCSGKRPPNAPKWTLNIGAEQDVLLPNDGKVTIGARAHYQSRTLTGLDFLDAEMQPGYWLADASIGYESPDRRYRISAFVNNIFNEAVFSNTFPPPLTEGLLVSSLRPPRLYGIRAGVSF